MFVSTTIYNFIQSNHGDCIPFAAPTDVRLDILKDDRTMVQPDIFIVCDEEKKVPVNIYDGKLKIDFGNMPKYITKWYDKNWQLITNRNIS